MNLKSSWKYAGAWWLGAIFFSIVTLILFRLGLGMDNFNFLTSSGLAFIIAFMAILYTITALAETLVAGIKWLASRLKRWIFV